MPGQPSQSMLVLSRHVWLRLVVPCQSGLVASCRVGSCFRHASQVRSGLVSSCLVVSGQVVLSRVQLCQAIHSFCFIQEIEP